MKTAKSPASHIELACQSIGTPNGHVPGNHYHDVDVVLSVRERRFRVHVCETWGSAQGYDEEHGRREVVARGDSISEVCGEARERAVRGGIEAMEYLEQAICLAEDQAEEVGNDCN